jgi:hypothetical protein
MLNLLKVLTTIFFCWDILLFLYCFLLFHIMRGYMVFCMTRLNVDEIFDLCLNSCKKRFFYHSQIFRLYPKELKTLFDSKKSFKTNFNYRVE